MLNWLKDIGAAACLGVVLGFLFLLPTIISALFE